jgi:mono/diheme cytochrome c family protein
MGPKTLISAAVGLASLVCVAIAQPTSSTSDKWQAPPEAAAKPNPESQKTAGSAVGRKLFIRTCARCHEEDGSGQNGGAANLSCPK